MKKGLLFISVLFLLNFIPNDLKAQYKVGCIAVIDDSLMTHNHIGWTFMENFKHDYKLPFSLTPFVHEMIDSIFSMNDKSIELIWIGREKWIDYKANDDLLRGKKFKKFSEEWYNKTVVQDSLDALLVFENIDPNLVYGMNANKIETKNIAISTGHSSKKTGVYIRMQAYLFWKPKPMRIKSNDYGIISDEFPMVNKKEKFSDDQLFEFEKALQESIIDQLLNIRRDPGFNALLTELRRNKILKEHK